MDLVPLVRQTYRALRYGRPIVVVSGLPRSGTSMMMQMLEAGGLTIASDGIRETDESNPQGYYELETVKQLDDTSDTSWLTGLRGKTVKIVSFFLPYLPESLNYSIIFMHRDLDEILASQAKMLTRRGEPSGTDDERMKALYVEHIERASRILASRPCFHAVDIQHRDVVNDPAGAAHRVNAFLGGKLNEDAMAAVVEPSLYRNRA